MKPISADSHVVEGRDVFTGLAERFGDEAPRIMDVGDQVDAIVVPARGIYGVSVVFGVDNLMWGSDYPHTDSTWPCSTEVLDEVFEGIPEGDRARITRDNVKVLYGV